jgi:hypothetical protein
MVGWLVNREGLERKRLWCNRGYIQEFSCKDWGKYGKPQDGRCSGRDSNRIQVLNVTTKPACSRRNVSLSRTGSGRGALMILWSCMALFCSTLSIALVTFKITGRFGSWICFHHQVQEGNGFYSFGPIRQKASITRILSNGTIWLGASHPFAWGWKQIQLPKRCVL